MIELRMVMFQFFRLTLVKQKDSNWMIKCASIKKNVFHYIYPANTVSDKKVLSKFTMYVQQNHGRH